jgi:6-phosphogluconate dehydrogenase
MQIAVVGLGRMGGDVARRLMRGGHRVIGWDVERARVDELSSEGAAGAASLADAVTRLPAPRAVWVMLPAGQATRIALAELRDLLAAGDTVVDGGNGDWREDAQRAAALAAKGVAYLDVGLAGGVHGLTEGYCLMIGGEKATVERLRNLFDDLAAPQGLAHVGPSGAGHFAKMVHDAIEYGMEESLAEGFDLLRGAPQGFDLAQVANLWRHGSVVRSWLLDLAYAALKKDPRLESVATVTVDSSEGRWAVETAIAQESPCTVLAASLFAQFRASHKEGYAMRLLAALRQASAGADPSSPPAKS